MKGLEQGTYLALTKTLTRILDAAYISFDAACGSARRSTRRSINHPAHCRVQHFHFQRMLPVRQHERFDAHVDATEVRQRVRQVLKGEQDVAPRISARKWHRLQRARELHEGNAAAAQRLVERSLNHAHRFYAGTR
ncbi:MAG: hypothetical protein SV422_13460, partial [Pseudomonadota bacterium]|nr:hypothetical protein [Pseudomonadota bacterium]